MARRDGLPVNLGGFVLTADLIAGWLPVSDRSTTPVSAVTGGER